MELKEDRTLKLLHADLQLDRFWLSQRIPNRGKQGYLNIAPFLLNIPLQAWLFKSNCNKD